MDRLAVWRIWNGDAVEKDQAAFIDAVESFRKKCGEKNRGSFAVTSYSEAILNVFQIALRRSLRGEPAVFFIQGDAGVGKTVVSRAWRMDNIGNVWMFEVPGPVGFKGMIGDIAEMQGMGAGSSYNQMRRTVWGQFERGHVLIVDEAHLLVDEGRSKQPKIDYLRRLCDIRQCSVVLNVTDDRFEAALADSSYNDRQLSRRFGRTMFLDWPPTNKDIRSLFQFKCPHIEMDDGMFSSFRAAVDHEKGGFGVVGRIIADAEDIAFKEDREVKTKDILISLADAVGLSGGDGKIIREGSLDKLRKRMDAKKRMR